MSNVTFKHVIGLGSLICLLIAATLVLKLESGGAKQTTLSSTETAAAAMANVQIAEAAVQAYAAANGSYAGMTAPALQAAGGGAALPAGFAIGWAETSRYCVEDTAVGGTAYLIGPGGTPAVGSCPAPG